MTTLSGNTLFHFTNRFDNIVSILRNGFYPRLCFEDGVEEKEFSLLPDIIIPMVCFCDMRLLDITRGRHIKDYGKYAIGVTKEWAKSNGVCPILYTFPKSKNKKKTSVSFTEQALGLIYGNIYKIFSSEKHKEIETNLNRIITGLGVLLSYTKRYEGYLYKNWERQNDLIRFYDEREWRYVPIIVNYEGKNEFIYDIMKPILMNANLFFNTKDSIEVLIGSETKLLTKQEYLDLQNKEFEIQALKMTSNDIKCIIVKNSDEIGKIRKEIYCIDSLKPDSDKIEIISIESYLNDF